MRPNQVSKDFKHAGTTMNVFTQLSSSVLLLPLLYCNVTDSENLSDI